MISLIFIIAALVLFILATWGYPNPPRFNLIAAGLPCYMVAILAGQMPAVHMAL